MTKRSFEICIASITLLLFSIKNYAQEVKDCVPVPFKLQVVAPPEAGGEDSWCWAYCSKFVLDYYSSFEFITFKRWVSITTDPPLLCHIASYTGRLHRQAFKNAERLVKDSIMKLETAGQPVPKVERIRLNGLKEAETWGANCCPHVADKDVVEDCNHGNVLGNDDQIPIEFFKGAIVFNPEGSVQDILSHFSRDPEWSKDPCKIATEKVNRPLELTEICRHICEGQLMIVYISVLEGKKEKPSHMMVIYGVEKTATENKVYIMDPARGWNPGYFVLYETLKDNYPMGNGVGKWTKTLSVTSKVGRPK